MGGYIKMYLREIGCEDVCWLRIGCSGGLLWTQ